MIAISQLIGVLGLGLMVIVATIAFFFFRNRLGSGLMRSSGIALLVLVGVTYALQLSQKFSHRGDYEIEVSLYSKGEQVGDGIVGTDVGAETFACSGTCTVYVSPNDLPASSKVLIFASSKGLLGAGVTFLNSSDGSAVRVDLRAAGALIPGMVIDENSKPVPGARVGIEGPITYQFDAQGNIVQSVSGNYTPIQSNAEGRFLLPIIDSPYFDRGIYFYATQREAGSGFVFKEPPLNPPITIVLHNPKW
jgi:hypothetical protein